MKEVSSGETNYSAAVTEPFNGQDSKDGTNILILGSDKRISQGSDARTDTIMVLNIGNKEGKVKLVGTCAILLSILTVSAITTMLMTKIKRCF